MKCVGSGVEGDMLEEGLSLKGWMKSTGKAMKCWVIAGTQK